MGCNVVRACIVPFAFAFVCKHLLCISCDAVGYSCTRCVVSSTKSSISRGHAAPVKTSHVLSVVKIFMHPSFYHLSSSIVAVPSRAFSKQFIKRGQKHSKATGAFVLLDHRYRCKLSISTFWTMEPCIPDHRMQTSYYCS
jgi:hypothetical protein